MSIRKRNGIFHYRFMFDGKVIRRSAKTGNAKVARQIESAHRTQLAKGEVGIKDRPSAPIFDVFAKRFTDWITTEKAAKPRTVKFYKDSVKQLLRFEKLRTMRLDEIDERLIADYIKRRTGQTRRYALRKKNGACGLGDTGRIVAVASVNRELATLRRMLNVARLWKVILAVPLIKLLPGERSHERVLSHSEESRYLAVAPSLLCQFATILLDTGMRPEEVCRLRWEYVHLEPMNGARFGYLHIPDGKTKYAKRNLSLTARVQTLLNMRHQAAKKPATGWVFPSNDKKDEPVPYSTIDSQHDRTIRALNATDKEANRPENPISRFRLYDLRHTFLTRLGEVNTDPFTIQKIAGHSTITMSQRYVHPTPQRVEDAFARLDAYNQVNVSETPNTNSAAVN